MSFNSTISRPKQTVEVLVCDYAKDFLRYMDAKVDRGVLFGLTKFGNDDPCWVEIESVERMSYPAYRWEKSGRKQHCEEW